MALLAVDIDLTFASFWIGKLPSMLRMKKERTSLSVAAGARHESNLMLLLERGAAVDIPDKEGCTPLSWPAENGCLLRNWAQKSTYLINIVALFYPGQIVEVMSDAYICLLKKEHKVRFLIAPTSALECRRKKEGA
jgi:hypothetical protein